MYACMNKQPTCTQCIRRRNYHHHRHHPHESFSVAQITQLLLVVGPQ